jgi:hypothetical protein
MSDKTEKYEIFLDLDRDRIKTVLLETYSVCKDTLETDFLITAEQFQSKINPYLDSNRISIPVSLSLPSRKYPELMIEVSLRNKSVIARMHNRDMRIHLNRYLTQL